MEETNAVNDAQTEFVEPSGETVSSADVAQEVAPCEQSPEENKAFADMRRRLEQAQGDAAQANDLRTQVDFLRKENARHQFDNDLAQIRKYYPECKAANVFELPETFAKLRANGIDTLTAYSAAVARKDNTPPSTGPVSSGSGAHEYYSNEELDRLTPSQLDNPKILEKALKSLHHLKKG